MSVDMLLGFKESERSAVGGWYEVLLGSNDFKSLTRGGRSALFHSCYMESE